MSAHGKSNSRQFALIALLTLLGLAVVWFGWLKAQRQGLQALVADQAKAQLKLQQAEAAIEVAEQVKAQVWESERRLERVEEGMAVGDLYDWAINTIREFKEPYNVDIPQFSQIEGPGDMSMLPRFPYKQINWTIAGTAYFHDFGRFLADFENRFPCARVVKLRLEPVPSKESKDLRELSEKEKLSFRMEIAALVKPGVS